jgi:hypothetical protein
MGHLPEGNHGPWTASCPAWFEPVDPATTDFQPRSGFVDRRLCGRPPPPGGAFFTASAYYDAVQRGLLHIALVAGAALALSGCGFADVHAPLPEFMRIKEAPPPPLEPPPDVRKLVRDHLDSVFVTNSGAQNVQVSMAHHDPVGTGWNACVRADVNSATGKPLGTLVYRIGIDGGIIVDRRRADPDDNCQDESYQPI